MKINSLYLALMTVAACALAGCGGGGGGGSNSSAPPTPTTLTITGTLQATGGSVIADARVTETQSGATTTTNSSGVFSLVLPASASETSVTIDFYNSTGQLELVQQYTVTASAGGTQNIGTVTEGPPPPPVTPGQ